MKVDGIKFRVQSLLVSRESALRPTTKKMTTRTATEIQTDLSAARRTYDNYNNVQNEGATDGFNPHLATIETLAAELAEEKKARVSGLLSGDSLTIEKEWFNNQGFNRPDIAQKACTERGYNMSDLVAAIKAAK